MCIGIVHILCIQGDEDWRRVAALGCTDDYVIKNIRIFKQIFTKFWINWKTVALVLKNFPRIKMHDSQMATEQFSYQLWTETLYAMLADRYFIASYGVFMNLYSVGVIQWFKDKSYLSAVLQLWNRSA